MRGLGESRLHRSRIAIAHRRHDVVGRLRPHHRRARFGRGNGIDHRRQYLVFDCDGLGRALRREARFRHHGRHRFAGKAHDLVGQQPPRRHRHRLAVGTRENQQRRQGADVVGNQIRAGVNRLDIGHASCGLGVDGHDPGMGMRRTQHMQPQRALFRLVVDELPLPGEKPLVLKALDGLARTETHITGKNVHGWVLRVFAGSTGVLADREGTGQALARRHSGAHRRCEPGISRHTLQIPGLRLAAHPGMTAYPAHPISRNTASTALRSSTVKAVCGATGSPTS